MRYGATEFGYMRREELVIVGFKVLSRNIRFIINIPRKEEFQFTDTGRNRKNTQITQAWEQSVKQRWRALALVIKAKLEAVESHIATFEEEFLPYIVLPNGKTVAEETLPAIEEIYKTGKEIPLLTY